MGKRGEGENCWWHGCCFSNPSGSGDASSPMFKLDEPREASRRRRDLTPNGTTATSRLLRIDPRTHPGAGSDQDSEANPAVATRAPLEAQNGARKRRRRKMRRCFDEALLSTREALFRRYLAHVLTGDALSPASWYHCDKRNSHYRHRARLIR